MEEGKFPTTYVVRIREDYQLSRRRIFLSCSSCAFPQCPECGNGGTMSTEQLKKLVVDNGMWRQHETIDTWSISRRMTVRFLQEIGSPSTYCYRCTNIGFVNSSTSDAPRTVGKGAFVQDPIHRKSSMAASSMGSWAQSLIGWRAPSCLFRWMTLQLVTP